MTSHDNSTIRLSPFERQLLAFIVISNSATVLIGRYTRSSVKAHEAYYSIQNLIIMTEIVKLIAAAALEERTEHWGLKRSLQTHVLGAPRDMLKMLLPALLYLVQNTLLMVALTNLTAPIFQVLYQSKLVLTAVISVVILNRSYRLVQWICIAAVSVGVAIVVVGERGYFFESNLELVSMTGIGAVLMAGLASSFATVYFEKVVKASRQSSSDTLDATDAADDAEPPEPASLWMRTMQLSFFTLLISIGKEIFNGQNPSSFFHGFTIWVWLLVIVQAMGGMLVSAVIKVSPTVLKLSEMTCFLVSSPHICFK